MRIRYYDWDEHEIDAAMELYQNDATFTHMAKELNRPMNQVRSLVALLERKVLWDAADMPILDYKISDEIRLVGDKLEKLKSPFAQTCYDAARYIKEANAEIRKRTDKGPWSPFRHESE